MKASPKGFRELRKEHKLNQYELAEKLGMRQSNIANLENEKKPCGLSMETFIGLCKVYNKTPSFVLKKLGIDYKGGSHV